MVSARLKAKHYIIGGICILIAGIIATSITSALLLREREIETWRRQLSDLSLVLAEQTSQTMSSAQLALDGIVEHVQDLNIHSATELRSKTRTEAMLHEMRSKITGLPQVDVATIVAANGDVINFTRSFPAPSINLSERDYFQARRDDPALGMYIGNSVRNKGNGKWVFYLSHRLNDSSGRFMGMVLVGISVDQFTDFYQHLGEHLGEGAAITLYRRDFSTLARWPQKDELIGKKNLTGTSHLVVEEMKKSDDVIYTAGPRFSNSGLPVARLGAVRLLERFPMIVNLTVTEDLFLANWLRTIRFIAVVATVSVISLVIAMFYLLRIAREREKSSSLLINLTDQVPGELFQLQQYPDGRISFPYVNKSFEQTYGRRVERLPVDSSTLFEYQHPEDRERISASIQDSANKLQTWHDDYRLVIPGTGVVWRHGDAHPQKLKDGSILWHGYIADITERKKVEQALQRESEKNLALLRNASDGIHILDYDGNIIEASDSFCAMLGYRREEVIGLNVSKWDAGFTESESLMAALKQQFEKPIRTQFETRHKRKDGSIFEVEVSGFPLELEGKPVLFNSSRDITQRKQSEAQIAKSLSLLNATLESTEDAILVVDMDNTWVLHNKQFDELWHIPDEIIASKDDGAALSFVLDQLEDADAFINKVRELYTNPEAISFDTFKFRDGKIVERYSVPQRIGGKVVGRVWSFRNVTETKLAESEVRIAATAFESQEGMLVTDANVGSSG